MFIYNFLCTVGIVVLVVNNNYVHSSNEYIINKKKKMYLLYTYIHIRIQSSYKFFNYYKIF